jgi:hypothetical protein
LCEIERSWFEREREREKEGVLDGNNKVNVKMGTLSWPWRRWTHPPKSKVTCFDSLDVQRKCCCFFELSL